MRLTALKIANFMGNMICEKKFEKPRYPGFFSKKPGKFLFFKKFLIFLADHLEPIFSIF
jgi:hypothetical protein